jgi:Tfp pilus assembly protein PilX
MTIKPHIILKSRSGAALVIALLMMIVITLIGVASTSTSIFEIKLAGNKRGSISAFYAAEGGIQAVVADIANFNANNFTIVNPATLPVDLQNESIDSKFSSPSPSLPSGVNFDELPQLTIYHTTNVGAPRGLGFSATGNMEYEYYIMDSVGKDQTDTGLFRSTCQIREKVVRLVPTSQGGN